MTHQTCPSDVIWSPILQEDPPHLRLLFCQIFGVPVKNDNMTTPTGPLGMAIAQLANVENVRNILGEALYAWNIDAAPTFELPPTQPSWANVAAQGPLFLQPMTSYSVTQSRTPMSTPADSGISEESALEMASRIVNDFRGEKQRPHITYTCDRCRQRGDHFIRDCPVKLASGTNIYQGQSRSIGKFKCPSCHYQWFDIQCFAKPRRNCIKHGCRTQNIEPVKMYSESYALREGIVQRDQNNQLKLTQHTGCRKYV